MILVISKYIHTSSNYMRYTQESTRFCDLSRNFGAGSLVRGWYLQKKNCVYLGLSLSLSLLHWRRELEERSGGVGPSRVQPPNFHIWSTRPLSGAGSPIALHLPLPIRPYSHNEPLRFASHMCMRQRPSLPAPLTPVAVEISYNLLPYNQR